MIAFIAIVALLFFSEFFQRKFNLSRRYIRKAIHIIVGLGICYSPLIFESKIPILSLAVMFLVIDWWALRTHRFSSTHPDTRSLGTIFYPISIFILAYIFWDTDQWIFITASLLMIIPDALAGISGSRLANSYFSLLGEKKSIPGTVTMFTASFILIMTASYLRNDMELSLVFIISVTVAALATVSELLSIRGSDNLSVPLIAGLFLYVFIYPTSGTPPEQIFTGTILALIISLISFYVKFLSISGAAGTFLLGSIIFGFGGLMYTLPIMAFFVLSSLLSLTGKKYKRKFESSFEKTGTRDFYQVWANGLIPAILVTLSVFYDDSWIYFAYCAALAAATADTWGTELGVFSKRPARLITTFEQVAAGTSGGISVIGSFAALLGSLVIAVIGISQHQSVQPVVEYLPVLMLLTVSGFSGSIIDSILGATLQTQYTCAVCRKITEKKRHCERGTKLLRGLKWLNNDFVNLLSITFAAFIMFVLLYFMYD